MALERAPKPLALTRRGGSGNRLGKAHTAGIQVLPSKKTLPPTRPGPLEAPPLSRPSAGGLELPGNSLKLIFSPFPLESTPRPPGRLEDADNVFLLDGL